MVAIPKAIKLIVNAKLVLLVETIIVAIINVIIVQIAQLQEEPQL